VITGLRRHASILGVGLAVGLACLVISFWMITEGTGVVLLHRGFDAFYDSQANSLAHGHWDVPPDAISGEAFVVHGKYYGYFGFTPALPRLFLDFLFPSLYGHWTRLLTLLWIASIIAAIVAFFHEFSILPNPFLLAAAILGSTLFFLCSHAIVYHEAIMTGAALALWAYYFFCRYLRQPRLAFLAVACMLSFLSFFARLTVGAGPLILASFLCMALLYRRFDWLNFPSPPAAASHAAVIALFLAFTGATYLSVNHAKFGTWLNPAPYQYHVQYDAARLARIEGNINHISNVPFNLSAYFGPTRIQLGKSFPWFSLTSRGPDPGSTAKIDLIERYSSIPAAMPALAALSILGIVFAVKSRAHRRALPVLIAAFTAACLILTNAYITYRYVHDYYPFLVIAAILGVGAIRSISSKRLRLTAWILIAVAGIWSIAANFAFTLRWQREDFWPEPAPQVAFMHLRGRLNGLLSFGKLDPIQYNIGDQLDCFRTGQFLTVVDPPATYRYDGRQWNYVTGIPLHLFRLRIKFPLGDPGRQMPLWFAGRPGASDAVYIAYSTPTRIKFCSDHRGHGGTCGPIVEIQPGREYRLRIDADRLNSALTVAMDDNQVLDVPIPFYKWRNEDVLFGKSLASAAGGDFTGEIRQDERK
jgi:hypothetical protein